MCNNFFIVGSAEPPTTSVSIVPAEQNVSAGESFNVGIYVVPSEPIAQIRLNLSFDPLLLQANEVIRGNLFPHSSSNYFSGGSINNTMGRITSIIGGTIGSNNASGYLANISFTAVDNIGVSLLNLFDVTVRDKDFSVLDVEVYDGNVTITGGIQNNPPVANDDFVSVYEDSSNNQVDVLGNDSDVDGDALTITGVSSPSHGGVSYDAGFVYYSPDVNYFGVDSFTYIVSDGIDTDTGTVYVTVVGVNDPPMISDENPSDGSSDVSINFSSISIVIKDVEGDSFDWSIETNPNIGSSNGSGGNGTKYCFVSGLNYDTVYIWYVNATDSNGDGTSAIFTFRVESYVPDEGYTLIVDADGPYTGSVGENISFSGSVINGMPPYTWLWDFGDGNTSMEQNPTHYYTTPGEYLVTLTVTDDNGVANSSITTVTITVEVEDGGRDNGTSISDGENGVGGGDKTDLSLIFFVIVVVIIVLVIIMITVFVIRRS